MKEIYLKSASDEDFIRLVDNLEIVSIKTDGNNSSITDQGLKYIATLSNLVELDLEWATNITDDGLAHLSTLKELKHLDLSFCSNISQSAIVKLKRSNVMLVVEQ